MADTAPAKECQEWEATMPEYHVCEHPELFVKDGRCFLCLELDGQISIFEEINHDKTTQK